MTVPELLAVFAVLGVPIRPYEAAEILRVETRYRLPVGMLAAECAAHTRELRLQTDRLDPSPDMVCAAGQVNDRGVPVVPTAVQAARDLVAGLTECATREGALRYAGLPGSCRPIRGEIRGPWAIRYYPTFRRAYATLHPERNRRP